ncbi:MAG: hypothetical protein D6715_01540 [Calditrichaeota bacterium]|nr:MAG: hypothetical protein D6715_01540 [Calditrichota bacterium]
MNSVGQLEAHFSDAVNLLKEYGIYQRLQDEIRYLVKYFDQAYFLDLVTQNLVDDIRGVFYSFCNRELKEIYHQLKADPSRPLGSVMNQKSINIEIFRSCALNVRYQVSGLMRMDATHNLLFKSSFFQFILQKLNMEIQQIYRELTNHYKAYFRKQYLQEIQNNNQISLACIEKKEAQFDRSFLTPVRRLELLHRCIRFVQQLFRLQLKRAIQDQVTVIFQANQEKIRRALDYFLEDLKKDFIKTMERQMRSGKDYAWIQRGFHLFLSSERFETHLQTIISRALKTIQRETPAA